MSMLRLCETLRSCADALASDVRKTPIAPSPELEEELARRLADARAAWPELALSSEDFFGYLAAHLPPALGPVEALRALHTNDMYLAAGCARRRAPALAAFEREFLAERAPALMRLRVSPDIVDEARQVVRARLFVGDEPKILAYSGTGPLRAWVRAALVREAIRLMRPPPKGQRDLDSETLIAAVSQTNDLELAYLKRLYGTAASNALREGFAHLEVRERNLLRQYFALGLSIDAIGTLYRVHRATAARWVTKSRDMLVAKTCEGIRRQLGLAPEDLSSVLRLIESQLTEGLRALLATELMP
jgi:RNA polymerase sigma-70 factor (ECF subfamily)